MRKLIRALFGFLIPKNDPSSTRVIMDDIDPMFQISNCRTPWQYKQRKGDIVRFWRETCGMPKDIPLRASHEAYYRIVRHQERQEFHERNAMLALTGYRRSEHKDPAWFD